MPTTTDLMPGAVGPAAKSFRQGTHRAVAPAATVERARRVMPALGITRVANITGLDSIGIPVVMVCRPNSRSLSVSQGKGMTLEAARASGLMEAVELHHGEHVTLPLKLASYNELRRTHELADLEALPRHPLNLFHRDRRLLWIEGWDLARRRGTWLPFELVHMDCTLPKPTGSGCFALTSNGLASGNHLFEALVHAISEVVERDAYARWSALPVAEGAQRRLELSTVDDPDCRGVLELYEGAGVTVAVWDITSKIRVPAFYCAAVNRDQDPFRPLAVSGGMGCHPSRQVALLRALVEAAQSRLTVISGSRDDVLRGPFEVARNPDVVARRRSELEAQRPVRRFRETPSWEADTFDDDVRQLLQRLASAGFDSVLAVDLTDPELKIPVVRVVVPGLHGIGGHG